jgi:hypothetical protein
VLKQSVAQSALFMMPPELTGTQLINLQRCAKGFCGTHHRQTQIAGMTIASTVTLTRRA